MGGFVPLPSPVNPYVSGAEQGAAAAAHAYNSAREAKIQRERLNDEQAQRATANKVRNQQDQWQHENEIRNQGGMPLYGVPDATWTGSDQAAPQATSDAMGPLPPDEDSLGKGLASAPPSTRNPLARGEGSIVTEPVSGRQWWVPTKGNLKQQEEGSVTLTEDLAKQAREAGFADIQAGHPYPRTLIADLNARIAEHHRQNDQTYTPHEFFSGDQSAGIYGLGNRGGVMQYQIPGQPGQSAPPQAGLPTGPFRTDGAAANYQLPQADLGAAYGRMTGRDQASPFAAQKPAGDPFAEALLGPAEPTAPAPSQSGAAPAQRTPGKAGGLTMRPPARPRTTSDKETPNDWIRIKTDPKSSPDEVKRATAAIAESRAGQTEADRDRHERETQAANDRAEREGERATDRADREAKENRRIETEKKKGIDAANKKYRTAMQTAFTPEAKKTALEELRSDLNETQGLYESATGSKEHSTWGATYDPEARSNDRGGVRPAPGRGGKPDRGGVRQLQ